MIDQKAEDYNNLDTFSDMLSLIDKLIESEESDEVEFKSAAGGFPKSFWETYSSFANTNGGIIILGVKERDGRFFLDNLTQEMASKYRDLFWRNVNNKEVVNVNLLCNEDVDIIKYADCYLLVVRIPRADRNKRPVYQSLNPYNGTYKRNFEGDFKCTDQEVRRMFSDSDTQKSPDARLLRHFSFDDIDLPSFEQYKRLFQLSKPEHPWLSLGNKDLMIKLGGYKIDKSTGDEGFTLAGLLMFGKTESICDDDCVPAFFPDYRELVESGPSQRWGDRICPDGLWQANLFQFYMRVLPKLWEILPRPFQMSADARVEETPAHIAVREALVNALVHADYSVDASIVVTRSKNEIVFSNPGSLLISKTQYFLGGDSVCRNKNIQKMFMMMGRAEKAGSGVDKILSGWRRSNYIFPNMNPLVKVI